MQRPRFPVHEDATTGRRWRWRLPIVRVAIALILFFVGFSLCVYGLSAASTAPGVAGLLCFAPGAWATYNYAQILRGRVPSLSPDTFLEVEEVGGADESDSAPLA